MAVWFYAIFQLMFEVMLVFGVDDNCPYQKCDCYENAIHCFYKELKKLPPLRSVNTTISLALLLNGNSLTRIPTGSLPPRLTSINFELNPITTIDQDAFNSSVDTLTELLFSNALFTELPNALLRLNNLTSLTISDMEIKTWNLDIMKHIGASLQTLILSKVGLMSWPSWIQYFPHLGTLELSSASIIVPDNAFDNLINTLTSLNLAFGVFTEIPSAVSKLTQLQTLILDNNNISRVNGIPNSPLSKLSLNENMISDSSHLSNIITSLSATLNELQVTNNQLTYLPDLSSFKKLQVVHLSDNAITYTGTSQMPASIKYLDLDLNRIKSLESFAKSGQNMIVLYIQNNSLTELRGVDIPASVQHMDISVNLISEINDDSFPSSSHLLTLNLDSNPIIKVSSRAFANLKSLTLLSMGFTRITRLPLSLTLLSSATMVDISNSDQLVCTCLEKEVFSWSRQHFVDFYGECGVTSIHNFATVMVDQCPD